jgi:hypothetical protein
MAIALLMRRVPEISRIYAIKLYVLSLPTMLLLGCCIFTTASHEAPQADESESRDFLKKRQK